MDQLDERPDPRIEECYSCGFETELKPYDLSHRRRIGTRPSLEADPEEWDRWLWLCKICASTPCGNAYEYPEQYPNRSTLETIAYVGNLLLTEIRALRATDTDDQEEK